MPCKPQSVLPARAFENLDPSPHSQGLARTYHPATALPKEGPLLSRDQREEAKGLCSPPREAQGGRGSPEGLGVYDSRAAGLVRVIFWSQGYGLDASTTMMIPEQDKDQPLAAPARVLCLHQATSLT